MGTGVSPPGLPRLLIPSFTRATFQDRPCPNFSLSKHRCCSNKRLLGTVTRQVSGWELKNNAAEVPAVSQFPTSQFLATLLTPHGSSRGVNTLKPLETSGEGEEGCSGPEQTGRCSGTSATSTRRRVCPESGDSDVLSRLKLQGSMPSGPSRLLIPGVGGFPTPARPSSHATWPKQVPVHVQAFLHPR